MRFTEVRHSDSAGTTITLRMLGDDRREYALEVSPEVALQMTLALRREATRLRPADAVFLDGFLYTLAACQPLVADQQREGLALTTREGFEIPLLLDAAARAALRACIDQLERGIPSDGPVH